MFVFSVFIYSIKWEREVRNVHIAVLQRRLRNNRKCTKKRDARAKLLFYKPIDFLPFSMQIGSSSSLRRGRQENILRY